MAIKSGTIFNKEKRFDGFINYGENIIVDDENMVATEALVCMLVGLKEHWKYPSWVYCTPYKEAIIGYIGGFIVRAMVKDISCDISAESLLFSNNQTTLKLPCSYKRWFIYTCCRCL